MRHDTTNATTQATIAVVFAIAIAVVAPTGCGLINAFAQGALPTCDGVNGESGCSCPDSNEVCRGDGCVCEEGFAVCVDIGTSCTVIGDNGCFNAACSCSGADCDCTEIGTCLSANGSLELFADTFATCLGDCRCNIEGCSCGSGGCTIGPMCTGDADCDLIDVALGFNCTADDGCGEGEFCGVFAEGFTTACFVESEDCAESAAVSTVDGGRTANVCAASGSNDCVDNQCLPD